MYAWAFPETALQEIDAEAVSKIKKSFTDMVYRQFTDVIVGKQDFLAPPQAPSCSSADSVSLKKMIRDSEVQFDTMRANKQRKQNKRPSKSKPKE